MQSFEEAGKAVLDAVIEKDIKGEELRLILLQYLAAATSKNEVDGAWDEYESYRHLLDEEDFPYATFCQKYLAVAKNFEEAMETEGLFSGAILIPELADLAFDRALELCTQKEEVEVIFQRVCRWMYEIEEAEKVFSKIFKRFHEL